MAEKVFSIQPTSRSKLNTGWPKNIRQSKSLPFAKDSFGSDSEECEAPDSFSRGSEEDFSKGRDQRKNK